MTTQIRPDELIRILKAEFGFTGGGGAGFHTILSGVHTDSAAAAVVRGDVMTGQAGPVWGRLPLGGIAGSIVTRDANDVLWSGYALSGTAGQTYAFPAVAGTVALGAGTLTVATGNDATIANHTHAITSSSNPGAAASILASDASGYLQLVRLGAGGAPSYPIHAYAASGTTVICAENDGGIASLILDGYRTADATVASVGFYNSGDSIAVIGVDRAGANDAGNMILYTQPTGGTATARVWVLSTGYVGIGMTPDSNLDVKGTTFLRASSTVGVTAEQLRMGRYDDDIRYHSIYSCSGTNDATNFIQFRVHDKGGSPYTGQVTALTLNASGVGVFVTSPASRLDIGAGAFTMAEMTAPSAPAANGVVIYAEDDGAGKTRLMALFSSGAAQQIAIQP